MNLAERVRERLGGELEVLPGGHSGLTYTVKDTYVVKAVPPGQKPVGRNDVLRQARVPDCRHCAGRKPRSAPDVEEPLEEEDA